MHASLLVPLALLLSFVAASPHPHPHAHPQNRYGSWRNRRPGKKPVNVVPASSTRPPTAVQSPYIASQEQEGQVGGTTPPSGTEEETTPIQSGLTEGTTNGNTTTITTGGTTTSVGAGLPANCFKKNNLGVGFLADGDPASIISSVTNQAPCMYGKFVTMLSASGGSGVTYDQPLSVGAANAKKVGAIYVLSLKPNKGVDFSVYAGAAAQIGNDLNEMATAFGGTVWLRLAHEFNWYSKTGDYTGSGNGFKEMWTAIAGAVDREKIRMYWCPNPPSSTGDDTESLHATWFPEGGVVDLVGIDAYLTAEGWASSPKATFKDSVPEAWCEKYAGMGLDTYVGEAGVLPDGGTEEQQTYWLEQIVGGASTCQGYKGFMWFEMAPPAEGDFKVFDSGVAAAVLS